MATPNARVSPASSPAAFARVRSGTTTIRNDCAAKTRTMYTAYAPRKPSVSAVRPNRCASSAPAPAAASAITTWASPVRTPLRTALRRGGELTVSTDPDQSRPRRTLTAP